MIWPIGQPAGAMYEVALRSRQRWLELAREKVLWANPCGSLHIAYEDDENAVIEEFAELAPTSGIECSWLPPAEIEKRWPAVNPKRLKGGLFSHAELAVDPRQAIARIPIWLAEKFGMQFHFNSTVVDVTAPTLRTAAGETWTAQRIF